MDDMSDFDMDDIMGSQEPRDTNKDDEIVKAAVPVTSTATRDEFEDEMEAMNEIDDLY